MQAPTALDLWLKPRRNCGRKSAVGTVVKSTTKALRQVAKLDEVKDASQRISHRAPSLCNDAVDVDIDSDEDGVQFVRECINVIDIQDEFDEDEDLVTVCFSITAKCEASVSVCVSCVVTALMHCCRVPALPLVALSLRFVDYGDDVAVFSSM
jgi:hypothetical protein